MGRRCCRSSTRARRASTAPARGGSASARCTRSSISARTARRAERPLPIIATVIDREQGLHVARLARLRLRDEEVEKLSGELSTFLDSIEQIGELDLEGVEPTSHVVDLENVLRPDEPRPSLPRERALENGPDATAEGFRVPSP